MHRVRHLKKYKSQHSHLVTSETQNPQDKKIKSSHRSHYFKNHALKNGVLKKNHLKVFSSKVS